MSNWTCQAKWNNFAESSDATTSRVVGTRAASGRFQSDQVEHHNGLESSDTTPSLLQLSTFLQETFKMTVPVFETIFAVPMTCQSCINDIEGSLQQLSGTSAVQ
jgi:hypothetical protein